MWLLIILWFYIIWQMVYIYNSDSMIKAKCKGKSLREIIYLLWLIIWENHKEWYFGSKLEDIVDEVNKSWSDLAHQAKSQARDLIQDIKTESSRVYHKATSSSESTTSKSQSSKHKKSHNNTSNDSVVYTNKKHKKSSKKS